MASINECSEDSRSITFDCVEVRQNIGVYYSGVISAYDLIGISWADVRRIEKDRDFESFLGIQRPLDPKRVKEISGYVTTRDACFPTSVILSVSGRCAEFSGGKLTLRNNTVGDLDERVIFGKVASVLDGQHRIEGLRAGLKDADLRDFLVPVSVFVDIDVSEQAYIFSTVNLAQTKVNRSLVYDLFELSKSPSPQKYAHNIAVVMDRYDGGPLHKRIKRLGSATPGRYGETITQAAFVESLLVYLSPDANADRDLYRRGKKLERPDYLLLKKHIFRGMMIDGNESSIAEVIYNYFSAVKNKWPLAWDDEGRGGVLNKTNGFKALMRFLRPVYLNIAKPGLVPKPEAFANVFKNISLTDQDFTIDNYPPGSSGQSRLYQDFMRLSGLDDA